MKMDENDQMEGSASGQALMQSFSRSFASPVLALGPPFGSPVLALGPPFASPVLPLRHPYASLVLATVKKSPLPDLAAHAISQR